MSAIAPNQTAFGCVITRNRLTWARTLAQSIGQHQPETEIFALLVDDVDEHFDPEDEPFEVLELSSLPVEGLDELRFKYTAFELCCAVKPLMLNCLLVDRGIERVVYFDVDIMVLSSLDSLIERFKHSDILLTPHLTSDLPRDGKRADDAHVMKSGIFNAGFVGVRRSSNGLAFLDWWWGKCRDNCVVDHHNGFFVDQKYLDLAIGMFKGVEIIDDPGCNVAYWNLHDRHVSRQGDRWLVNDRPLLFFHFSDYRLSCPETMSGHQDRFVLNEMPDLKSLFEHYRQQLVKNGYEECRKWPYGFATYNNGRRIAARTRRAFRLAPDELRPKDPFDSSSHTFSLRIRSAWEGLLWLFVKFVDRFVARRRIRF